MATTPRIASQPGPPEPEPRSADARALRSRCLAQRGASEELPFGERTSVFKVAGKMFALSSIGSVPLQVSLKCEPELAERLRLSYPAIQPGSHLNKRHWNTIMLDAEIAAASRAHAARGLWC